MSKESAIELVKKMWISTKYAMKEDNYKYDTLEEAAIHYDILERIMQVFSEKFFSSSRCYELKIGTNLTRVVGEKNCNIDRIIPKKEFCSANRMNPKDKFYGYYVIDYCGQSRDERIKTGIKEIRAEKSEEISSCEFTVNKKSLKLAKFVSDKGLRLKLDEDTKHEDANRIKRYYDIHGGKKGKQEIAEIYAFNLMLNTMIEGEVFCPVDGDDNEKTFHYAPFRLIADYFDRHNFDGILYQSSVDPNGYCVAIFQPDNMIAIDDSLRCNINVNNLLKN